jgi:hypothetical protein
VKAVKMFRVELVVNGKQIDYMDIEADSTALAFQKAVSRFEKAYPYHTKKAKFNLIKL